MKNKTKKITKLVCAVLLILVLQSIGYTYAKYITEEKGTGYAEVAKWAFEIDKDGEQTKTVQLKTGSKDSLVNGKIAPGTNGTMVITLDATGSEVDVDYNLKFSNEKNKPTNLTFTYLGTKYKTLSEINVISGTIGNDETSQTREIQVGWSWPYETGETTAEIAANDEIDTQEANSIEEYTFDIIATGTQSL